MPTAIPVAAKIFGALFAVSATAATIGTIAGVVFLAKKSIDSFKQKEA